MANKTLHQKWIKAISTFAGGDNPTCPNCGGHKFKEGYILSKFNANYGWGAIWCDDCRNAFVISRALLADKRKQANIVNSLPPDLKFVE